MMISLDQDLPLDGKSDIRIGIVGPKYCDVCHQHPQTHTCCYHRDSRGIIAASLQGSFKMFAVTETIYLPKLESQCNHTHGNAIYPALWQSVTMWVIPILTVLLNSLVFVVAPRMKSIRPCTSSGMISLALADFALGVTHLIRLIYTTSTGDMYTDSHPLCLIDGYFQALFASISILTLTVLNLDRFLTFFAPMRYPRLSTPFRVKLVHGAIWIFMAALLALNFTGVGTKIKYYERAFMCVPDWAGHFASCFVMLMLVEIVPTLIIFNSFVGMFILSRKRRSREIRRSITASRRDDTRRNSQWRKDLRIFKTLAFMTFGFYVAWTPYFVTVAIPELFTGRSLNPITDFVSPWLGASNSFWNPLIYIPTMRPFYVAMLSIFTSRFTKPWRRFSKGSYDVQAQNRVNITDSVNHSSSLYVDIERKLQSSILHI